MERTFAGVAVLIVVIVLGWINFFVKKDSAGEEFRALAKDMVKHVDGYSANSDYYDWLADEGHDNVIEDAIMTEHTGRRRVRISVDEDKYFSDLLNWMIAEAQGGRATGVADALKKFKAEKFAEEPPPPKRPGSR